MPFTLLIEQLTGKKRRVIIDGRALPLQEPGLVLEAEMRHETDWLPGNPEATLQVFGLKLEPTTISGRWSDRFFARGDAVGAINGQQQPTAQALVDAITTLHEEGQVLSFRWGPVKRFGILDKWKVTYGYVETDIHWEMTFEWISKTGELLGTVALPSRGLQDQLATLANGSNQLQNLVQNPQNINHPTFLESVRQKAQAIADEVSSMGDTVANFASGVQARADSAQQMVGKLTEGIQSATSLIDETQARVYAELVGLEDVAQATVGQTLAAYNWCADLFTTGGSFRRDAVLFWADTRERLGSDVIAVHAARDREDLRAVSIQYYGNPDGWVDIMKFNGLDTDILQPGQQVLIPRLNNQSPTS